MKKDRKARSRREEGIALLIAIFVLLLISVVAIALLVSSGTETALGANYRSSSTVYYAALAGLEEARGRLLPKNPNYFNISTSVVPTPLPLGQAVYVINRVQGETIAPCDSTNRYYDNEYQNEFGVQPSSCQPVYSVWDNNAQGIPGPAFKWARINAATEQSMYIDVDSDGTIDPVMVYYNPSAVNGSGNSAPSLTTAPTSSQALEVTALGYSPNGSKKILQYLVAPVVTNLTFPAALTLDGFSDAFSSPNHHTFQIKGDYDSQDCANYPSMAYPVPAIGVPDQNPDVNNVISGIPSHETGNFTGTGSSPSVSQVTLAANLQTVQSLDQIVQSVIQNADAVIAGPADQSKLPSAMSSANPMTVAIQGDPAQPHQGDFYLGSGVTGYGLLLVTGKFTYDAGANWNGIILVIGQGTVTATTSNGSGGTFNGAMLVAQTRDLSGNLLQGPPNPRLPGPASFNDTLSGNVGAGIIYNCGWIQAAEAPLTYKVLSFHEIPQ